MQVDQELLRHFCPVCGHEVRQVRIERVKVNRRGAQAGPNPMPVHVEAEGIVHEETFLCGMVRSCMMLDGRWGDWDYDKDHKCQNAQEVVLRRNNEKERYHGSEI